MALPVSLTFHIGRYTVTIKVSLTHREKRSEDRDEKNNRHSGK